MDRHYSYDQNNSDLVNNANSVNMGTSVNFNNNNNTTTVTNQNQNINSQKKPKRPPILPNEIKCILLQGYGSFKQLKAVSIPRLNPFFKIALIFATKTSVLVIKSLSLLKKVKVSIKID